MTKPNTSTIPVRRNYLPLKTELPFIAGPRHYRNKHGTRHCGKLWHVHRIEDYTQACKIGREYAAHFAQYLKDHPQVVGQNLLGRIATDMDFHDASAKRGYWIGFFSYLEQLIYAQALQRPVFTDLDQFNTHTTALRMGPTGSEQRW